MIGKAYAAGTILNALATGIGCAFGIDLKTIAKVKIDSENVFIVNGENRNPEILNKILSHFGIKAQVILKSDIPERSGLGSSSAFINAVLCAIMKKEDLFAHKILRLNAELSLKAGISYTGAFDDASASLLSGVVLSDNYKMKLYSWIPFTKRTAVLIPEFKRGKVDWDKIKSQGERLKNALEKLKKLEFREVMVENTKFYCEMIGYPLEIAERLWKEDICCGLSGNGPAFVAIGNDDEISTAKEVWKEYGEVIIGKIPEKPAEEVVITSDLFISP
ncbi:MAG: shikimate kinase [Archaeoglobaceae archaeon]|nr:shikimate kinase [Archaeoglobaceae archaeon]MDW8117827.1 shikimate kinase [Archaeoglobaceae archaeon]